MTCRRLIGGFCWIVSVTGTCVSWLSPEFSMITWNASRSEALTVLSSSSDSSLPPGLHAHAGDAVAVQAARLRARRQPLDDQLPRSGARELEVADEVRVRDDDVRHPLLVQHALGRHLDEVVVDDVARQRAGRTAGRGGGRPPPRSAPARPARTPARAPSRPFTRSCIVSTSSCCWSDERPRRGKLLGPGEDLLLLRRSARRPRCAAPRGGSRVS